MSLRGARALLERARDAGAQRILVGFSGGKDSLATLDLCVGTFGASNVEAYFMYLVEGLRCVETLVDWAGRRYGVRIHKLPHFVLGNMYKHAVLMPHRPSVTGLRDTKMTDIEALARQRSGIEWLAYGHRMDESLERRGMLHKLSGINFDQKRVYPLWDWRKRDVYSYLGAKRLPIPCSFGKEGMAGVDLGPDTLRYMRQHYPEDYAKVLRVFPFAEAQLKREDFYGQERDATPAGRDDGDGDGS
jgi:3'-phosphoadenosine 5'-phosphosulfate sulfotransferase (PAPS reductase)/FAD synthetase